MTRRLATVVLLAALPLAARTPGQPDTDFLLSHLDKTQQMLADVLTGLTPQQWTFSPGEERWSIQQCAEHLALSEDFLRQMIEEQVMKSPLASEEQKKAVLGRDEKVMQAIPDRSQRFQAPDPVRPQVGKSPEEIREWFLTSRGKTRNFVKSSGAELRKHITDHPVFEQLDAYQWVLFLSSHVERHVAQIKEVKADPGYPR